MTATSHTEAKPDQQTQAGQQVDARGLPTDPDELRNTARAMLSRLQRIDQDAASAAEPRMAVRWRKEATQGMGQINGRTYSGRGPVYRRRLVDGAGPEVTELVEPGEVQELPQSVAVVLSEAGYVELLSGELAADAAELGDDAA
jgi:hypothetical protein